MWRLWRSCNNGPLMGPILLSWARPYSSPTPTNNIYRGVESLDIYARARVLAFCKRNAAEARLDAAKQNVVVLERQAKGARDRGDEVTARQAEEGLKAAREDVAQKQRAPEPESVFAVRHGTGDNGDREYYATIDLPLPSEFGARVGVGAAPSAKEAEIVAAMHAEQVLDTLGIHIYSMPSSQRRHAEARKAAGMWAPTPGVVHDPIEPTRESPLPMRAVPKPPPPPEEVSRRKPLKKTASGSELQESPSPPAATSADVTPPLPPVSNDSDKKFICEHCQKGFRMQIALDDHLTVKHGVAASEKIDKVAPSPSRQKQPRTKREKEPFGPRNFIDQKQLSSSHFIEDETEGGKYNLVYEGRNLEIVSSEVGCAQPYVKGMQAMRRLQTFFHQKNVSYDKALKTTRVVINNDFRLGGGLKICECELPLEPMFGVRIACGVAMKEKNAEAVMAMHAEAIIDSLGVLMYPGSEYMQAERCRLADFFGRWCPSRHNDHRPDAESPLPYRFSSKPNPHKVFLGDFILGAIDIEHFDYSANQVMIAYFQRMNLGNIRTYSYCFRVLCFVIEAADPTDANGNTGEGMRQCHAVVVRLPIPNGAPERVAIGIGTTIANAETVASMHMCNIFTFLGMTQANGWTPDPDKVSLSGPPCLRKYTKTEDSIPEGSIPAAVSLLGRQPRPKQQILVDKDIPNLVINVSASAPRIVHSPDGFLLARPDVLGAAERPCKVHSLFSPNVMCRQSRERVRRFAARTSGKEYIFPVITSVALRSPVEAGRTSVWHMFRATLELEIGNKTMMACGEGAVPFDAEMCMFMHAELLIDASDVPLFDDAEIQAQHVEYITSVRPEYRPTPIRNCLPECHTWFASDAPTVVPTWNITECDLVDVGTPPAPVYRDRQNPGAPSGQGEMKRLMTANEQHKRNAESIVIAVADYLSKNCREFNPSGIFRPLCHKVGKTPRALCGKFGQDNVYRADAWLPMPDGSLIPLLAVGSMRDMPTALCMYAARVLDAVGIPLFSDPNAQKHHVSRARLDGRVVRLTLDLTASLPKPVRVVSDRHPFFPLHLERSDNLSREAVERKKMEKGLLKPKREFKETTPKKVRAPRIIKERVVRVKVEVEPHAVPAAPTALPVSTPEIESHLGQWTEHAAKCALYISERTELERVWYLRLEKVPPTGDALLDSAQADAQRQPVEVHVKTNLYNFCIRKGIPYPTFHVRSTKGVQVVSFPVPAHEHYTAQGCHKSTLNAIRRAAMHSIEILRRVEPEFQTHLLRGPPSVSLTTLNMTTAVMRRLIELYSICVDVPPVRVRTACERLPTNKDAVTTITCTMSLHHSESEQYTAVGTHGNIKGAEEAATVKMFQLMYANLPGFQALLDLMRTHPQLRPEHVITLQIPEHITGAVDTLLTCESAMAAALDEEGPSGLVREFESLSSCSNLSAPRRVRPFDTLLPVNSARADLASALKRSNVVVLCGTTGCGKTTQIPQFILDDDPNANIVVTQPRRISAISIAGRVAQERGEAVGHTVGYSVRFDAKPGTHINFCTTGIVLRQLLFNPTLEGVTHLVIDEVHERDVNTDFLLILVKRLLRSERGDLRVIIMSATLNATAFADYFGGAVPMVSVEGQIHSVNMHYLDDISVFATEDKVMTSSMAALARAQPVTAQSPIDYTLLVYVLRRALTHDNVRGASVLVFLPGLGEIHQAAQTAAVLHDYDVIILHSNVSQVDQMKCFDPALPGRTKLILATNIAESAVTIPDVRVVIDLGRAKELIHKTHFGNTNIGRHERTTTASLVMTLASKANSVQRKGRAGRTQGGTCYRMYSKDDFERFEDYRPCELQRMPLEGLCLQVLSMGVTDLPAFFAEALDAPSEDTLDIALKRLRAVGATDDDDGITPLGRVMNTLPVHPSVARTLLVGSTLGCLDSVLTLAALKEVPSIYSHRDARDTRVLTDLFSGDAMSDHLAGLNAYNEWAAKGGGGGADTEGNADLESFIKDNDLSPGALKMVSRYKKEFYTLLRRIGFAEQSNSSAGAFVDTSAQSRFAQSIALVKGMLCCMNAPSFALHSGVHTHGQSSQEYRTKMEPVVRVSPVSCVTPKEGASPFIVFSGETYSEKMKLLVLRDVSVVSLWAILLLGVDNSSLTYREDLGLCVIDDWVMVNMDEATYDTVRKLKDVLSECVSRKVMDPHDDANNTLLAQLASVVERLVKVVVVPNDGGRGFEESVPWTEMGVISSPSSS